MTQPDIAALAREACVIEHTSAIEIGPPCSCCERIVAAIQTAEKSAWTRGYEHGLRGANISLAASQARVKGAEAEIEERIVQNLNLNKQLSDEQAHVGRLVEAARATQAWLIENGIGGHHHTCSGQDDAISCDCPGTAVAAAIAAAEPSGGVRPGTCGKDHVPPLGAYGWQPNCPDCRALYEPAPAPTAACDCCRKTCTNECQCFDKMPAPAPEVDGSIACRWCGSNAVCPACGHVDEFIVARLKDKPPAPGAPGAACTGKFSDAHDCPVHDPRKPSAALEDGT